MRKQFWIVATLLALLLSACAPISPTPGEAAPAGADGDETALLAAIEVQLAADGVPVGEFEITVQVVAEGYARAHAAATTLSAPEDFDIYMKQEAQSWTLLAYGPNLGQKLSTDMGVPASVLPEELQGAAAGNEDTPAEQAGGVVRQMLMQQLQVNFDEIEVVSVEAVDWPDACLGVPNPVELCAAVITPGYRVVVNAAGQEYVVHTNADTSVTRLASAPAPETGDVILSWEGAHGDAGCQMAEIGMEGVAFGTCTGGQMAQGYLAGEGRAAELAELAATFAPFEADTSAGGVRFSGAGAQEATPAEQRMIAEWAKLATLEASAGRSGASWGLALAWHREGGIAGFCDDLAVYVTGQAFATSCKGNTPQELGKGRLNTEELEQLYGWLDRLQGFEAEQSDGAVADSMTMRLLFNGTGTEAASEDVQAEVAAFAAALHQRLSQ